MKASHDGFMLIEVLLALGIIALGIQTFLAFEVWSIKRVRHEYYGVLAHVQLESMAERLRANHTNAARMRELQLWNRENAQLLPRGFGSIGCEVQPCVLKIKWHEDQEQKFELITGL